MLCDDFDDGFAQGIEQGWSEVLADIVLHLHKEYPAEMDEVLKVLRKEKARGR